MMGGEVQAHQIKACEHVKLQVHNHAKQASAAPGLAAPSMYDS